MVSKSAGTSLPLASALKCKTPFFPSLPSSFSFLLPFLESIARSPIPCMPAHTRTHARTRPPAHSLPRTHTNTHTTTHKHTHNHTHTLTHTHDAHAHAPRALGRPYACSLVVYAFLATMMLLGFWTMTNTMDTGFICLSYRYADETASFSYNGTVRQGRAGQGRERCMPDGCVFFYCFPSQRSLARSRKRPAVRQAQIIMATCYYAFVSMHLHSHHHMTPSLPPSLFRSLFRVHARGLPVHVYDRHLHARPRLLPRLPPHKDDHDASKALYSRPPNAVCLFDADAVLFFRKARLCLSVGRFICSAFFVMNTNLFFFTAHQPPAFSQCVSLYLLLLARRSATFSRKSKKPRPRPPSPG